MLEGLKDLPAQIEQYKTIMRIVNMWDTLRTPVILTGIVCLLLAIFLFVRKKGGRIFFLVLAIILGLTTIGMDKFKEYVEKQKKEIIKEQLTTLPKKIIELPEKAIHTVTEPLKKIFPFGKK